MAGNRVLLVSGALAAGPCQPLRNSCEFVLMTCDVVKKCVGRMPTCVEERTVRSWHQTWVVWSAWIPDGIFALQDHILNFVNYLSGFLHGRTTPRKCIPARQGHAIRIALQGKDQ